MQRKQGRDKRTAQPAAGRQAECHEQHCGADRVEQGIRKVMTAGPPAVDLRVEHQREPGQRDPVAIANGRQTPSQTIARNPFLHVRVQGDIHRIVDADETEVPDLRIDQQRGGHERGGE